ncbi:hypothetical protein VBY78_003928 [Enterobacter bugandensis]|nr:hypothetical protein [Enterobacter bugandensis]
MPKVTLNKVQKLHFLSTMKFKTLSFELALMLTRSSKKFIGGPGNCAAGAVALPLQVEPAEGFSAVLAALFTLPVGNNPDMLWINRCRAHIYCHALICSIFNHQSV